MSPYEPKEPAQYRYPRAGGEEGYPGADLSPERQEKLRTLDIEPGEVTADDIVWNVSRNGSSYFFALMRTASELYGEEAAEELARRLGYTAGGSNYRKMQRRYGVTTLTPEMLAIYEDAVHILQGVFASTCTSEYDETTWIGRRKMCPFHTGAPDGAGHYCRFVQEGFDKAYLESDPNIKEILYEESLMDGGKECRHRIVYKDAEDQVSG